MDLSPQDRDLMVRTVIGEAGGESPEGQAAVASVILNRLKSGQYGNSASDVVLAPNQFEPWSTKAAQLRAISPQALPYQAADKVVGGVLSGDIADPTGGATHFLNPKIVQARTGSLPKWAQNQTAKIGNHNFYAPDGPVADDLLGSWGSAPQKQTPAVSPTRITITPSGGTPDLLGAWIAPTASQPAAQTPPPATPPVNETPSQWTARMIAEHQGSDWADMAARLGLGTLRGVGDVADTIAEGITGAGRHGADALASAGVISPQTALTVGNWADRVQGAVTADRNAFDVAAADSPLAQGGRLAGQIVGSGPFLEAAGAPIAASRFATTAGPIERSLLAGAGVGAGAAALTSASSDDPLALQVGTGAATGAAMGPLGYGASAAGRGVRNFLFGAVDPETAQLAAIARNRDIPITAGQMSGGYASRLLDSVLQRIPFSGYAGRTAAQQTGLNRAVASEMGVTADAITPGVIDRAKANAYKDYDAAKANMGMLSLDNKFYQDLRDVYDNAHYNLEDNLAEKVDSHLRNVLGKIDPQTGTLDPDLYQSLTRKNGPLDTAINSRDSKISGAASGIKDALENLVGRNDPALKELKDKADYKWFVAKSLEDGRENVLTPTGDVNPRLLRGAVDRSGTPVGTLGNIARRFMVEPPSSNTSERLMMMAGLKGALGAAGISGAYAIDPEDWQRNAILGALAFGGGRAASSLLRSNLLANSMIRSGMGARLAYPSANVVGRYAPAAALAARPLLLTGPANSLPGQ